jgi:two-component system OmpR family response regulator
LRAILVDGGSGGAEEVVVALHLGWEESEIARTTTGRVALEELRRLDPDVVVVCGAIPDVDDTLLVEQLRHFSEAVIIAVSLEYDEGELIDLTAAGADDYMSTPIDRTRFIARVRAALRRVRPRADQENAVIEWRDLVIDRGRHEAKVGDQPLRLTATEFKLMSEIAQRGGLISDKGSLCEAVWGEPSAGIYGDLLRKYIHNLRRKLEAIDGSLISIETVPSVGYKLSDHFSTRRAS